MSHSFTHIANQLQFNDSWYSKSKIQAPVRPARIRR